MTDVASGAYQQYNPFFGATYGRLSSTAQVNQPPRSNVEIFGPQVVALAANTSEKAILVAVPVTWGDVITNVRIGTVTTASESGGEFIGAVYSGLAVTEETKVLGESAVVKEEFKIEKGYSLPLKKTVLITPANAPQGFVYAGFFSKETTAAIKVAGWKVTAALQYTSTTVKQSLGAYYSLTEASTGSFASAKSGFEVIGSKISTEIPFIILT